jgi:hypothetical protein
MAFAPPSAFGAEILAFQLDGGMRRTRRPPGHGQDGHIGRSYRRHPLPSQPDLGFNNGTALEVDGGVHNLRVRQPRPIKG